MYQFFFKKKKLISPYLFVVIIGLHNDINVHAQTKLNVDSLKNLLEGGINDNKKFDLLYEISFQLFDVDNSEALKYASMANEVARRLGDSLKIVKSNRNKGQLLRRLDDLDGAIEILSEALAIAKRNKFLNEEKSTLNALAIVHTFKADYDRALDYHFQSLIIREQEGRKDEISNTLNNIGLVYFKLRNYQKAIEFYDRALKLKEETENRYNLDRLLINIGLCYNQLGDYVKSKKFFQRAFASCSSECGDHILVEGKFGLGVAHYFLNEYDLAQKYLQESYQIAKRTDSKRFQGENQVYIAHIYRKLGKKEEAIAALTEAESIGKTAGYNELLIETYRDFSKLFTQSGEFEKASNYQGKYIALKDSIYNEQLIDNIAKVTTEYAERENKAIIASNEILIKQQRDLNIAVAIIAILAGLLILVLQRSNRVTKQVNAQLSEAKEVIQEQNKMLESKNRDLDREVEKKTADLERVNISLKQVNDELDNFIYKTSHDIRGPLASLKGMCNVALMDVKDPIALEYLRKLDSTAERLNTILTRLLIINQINNSKLTVSRIDFNYIVNDVLLLERKKGLPQKLQIRYHIEPNSIIHSDRELVRIVLENLIDNAIKFYNESDRVDSFVEIDIAPQEDGNVKVRVLDNGIGITESNPGKLFQMFFRASERSEIGGIGLYIVKTATSKLGGRVGLLTTPEGHTEFYVLFPSVPPKVEEVAEKHRYF